MHPGSTEYSMPNGNVVNRILDAASKALVGLFDRGNSFLVSLSWNLSKTSLQWF